MSNINILFESIKTIVFQSEIENLEKCYKSQSINPIFAYGEACNIFKEIHSLKDINQLKKYITEGGGVKPEQASQYISDLYFSTTNQIN